MSDRCAAAAGRHAYWDQHLHTGEGRVGETGKDKGKEELWIHGNVTQKPFCCFSSHFFYSLNDKIVFVRFSTKVIVN